MISLPEIKQLSIPEQILLVEEIWDNIARETSQVELPAWHEAILDTRWENYLKNPGQTVSWEQIQADMHRQRWHKPRQPDK